MKKSPNNQHGAIAVISLMIIAGFALAVITTVSFTSINVFRSASAGIDTEKTFYAAEAGVNEALYRLITHPVPEPFSVTLEGIDVDVTVSANPADPYQRFIVSRAEDQTGKVRTLRIAANTMTYSGGFEYALQSGEGGIELLNNSKVIGDVYTNGSIFGGTGAAIQATVDGNAWVAHGSVETAGPGQEAEDINLVVASAADTTDVSQSFVTSIDSPLKTISMYLKRNGTLPGDVSLRIIRDNGSGSPSNDVIVSKEIKKNDFPTTSQWFNASFDIGPVLSAGTVYWIVLDSPTFDASKYLVWDFNTNPAGYADGVAKKSSDYSTGIWESLNGDFKFKTHLGYGNTFVRQVEVTGDLYANTIDKSVIVNNAHYQTISPDTTVNGTKFPGSSDPDPKPFPISDAAIADWKNNAAAGGVLSGDQNISGTVTLGPKKISGNLTLSGNAHLVVSGPVWVTGNIIFNNPGIHISLDPNLGPASSVIISDGKIDINNNATISGSGDPKSFLLLLSVNNSLNPASPAINAANNSQAVIYYAKNGMVRIYNGSHLNGSTGYYLTLEEGSTVTYDPNLASFTVPTGSDDTITPLPDSWTEL
ncbi:MAG: hypothetical protein V1668_03090 [Patescibacteria group bacterium]